MKTMFKSAFTLLELLMVCAIIGILTALALPTLQSLKQPNIMLAATRQILNDVTFARHLAISKHTTVYMVFVPAGFWTDPSYNAGGWTDTDRLQATNLFDKQMTGYNFVCLRQIGDQPGQRHPAYLSYWRTLPDGVFIAPQKFVPYANYQTVMQVYTNGPNGSQLAYQISGFHVATNLPFPSTQTPLAGTNYVVLPYIAFNFDGQIETGQDELIPLVQGSIHYRRNPVTGQGTQNFPQLEELPPGNSTNAFNLINVEWLTGKVRLIRQEPP